MTTITKLSPDQERKTFLSLKWKAFIVISLVVIVVNGLYYIFNYTSLITDYQKQREEIHQQNIVMLQSIFDKSNKELQNLGNLIPEIREIKHIVENNDWANQGDVLARSMSTLQIPYDINAVVFYGKNSERLFSSLDDSAIDYNNDLLKRTVAKVNRNLHPESIILCSTFCMQASVVPYLSADSQVSIIALFSSIADIILDYSKLARKDIAIIGNISPNQGNGRLLPRWNKRVDALTNSNLLGKYVTQLASNKDIPHLKNSILEFSFQGKTYENQLISMETLATSENIDILVIDDVTQSLEEVDGVAKDGLVVSLLALLSSEVALLVLLWGPLSRLRATNEIFPMLAEGLYEGARKTLNLSDTKTKRYSDEIDLVNFAAFKLSHQLENLNREVSHYTQSLAENMKQLQGERDFNEFLLQTAQVIIVTSDSEGRVVLVNKYGSDVAVYGDGKIEGSYFADLFVTLQERLKFKSGLQEIRNLKLKNYSNESSFYTSDGVQKNIAWVHSYLGDGENGKSVLLSIGSDITERKEAEKRISWLANHDPLTGLYNRRYFNEIFENVLQRNLRYKKTGAILYLDLDNFKFVNDTLGHQAGDKLIKDVSFALKRITRTSDIVSRIGGDEFAIVIQDIDKRGVMDFCDSLNRRINTVISPITTRQNISTSIGIAMFPNHGRNVNQLLVNADIAMYQAKEQGKGGWHLFSEKEQAKERIQHTVSWKEKIEHALINDRFVLFFQPIMNITNGRITHYEVLLRMLDGNNQPIAPLPFIEVAESTGLIDKIDMLVLEKTLIAIKRFKQRGINAKFSVNLSAYTFSDRKKYPSIRKIIKNAGVDSSNLVFEITETAALQDMGAACELIEDLRNLGCRFAIDDFGVGFSSFYYLRELPVEFVKIDGSFIQQLARNPDDQLIVKAMSEIVQGFGKQTIAEYVEDERALSLLKEYKVDYAQGYYIGAPSRNIKRAGQLAIAES